MLTWIGPKQEINLCLHNEGSRLALEGCLEVFQVANQLIGGEAYTTRVFYSLEELLVTGTLRTRTGKPNSCMFIGGYDQRWWLTKPLISPIRHLVQSSQRTTFVGSAVFIAAEIGMLDTRDTAIHPNFQSGIFEEYGAEPSGINPMQIDGKIFTATGGVAAILIALEFVKSDLGDQIKNAVAQVMGLGETEAPIVSLGSLYWDLAAQNDKMIKVCISEMKTNIETPVSIAAIAKTVHVSVRQVERKFDTIIGVTPSVVYKDIRLNHAQKLLRQSQLSVVEVGFAAGFGCSGTFSRSYRKRFGITPREDRASKAARCQPYKISSQNFT